MRLASRITALTGGTYAVDSVVVTGGGTGYTSVPTVVFSSGAAAGTATIAGGQIISVAITNPGTGYTSAPTVSFSGGGGSGATATAVMLALDLDAIPTLALSLSLTPAPFVFLLLSGQLNLYRLRAGTDAEVSPFIIRPNDYAGGTNEKVWELIGANLLNARFQIRTLTDDGAVELNFDDAELKTVAITQTTAFTSSNLGAGKKVEVRVVADGSSRTVSFPAWKFIGAAAPASLAASKTAILKLISFGTTDADVVAWWDVEP